jgi:hypothetical protein
MTETQKHDFMFFSLTGPHSMLNPSSGSIYPWWLANYPTDGLPMRTAW